MGRDGFNANDSAIKLYILEFANVVSMRSFL